VREQPTLNLSGKDFATYLFLAMLSFAGYQQVCVARGDSTDGDRAVQEYYQTPEKRKLAKERFSI
jgi:hypothetical protein